MNKKKKIIIAVVAILVAAAVAVSVMIAVHSKNGETNGETPTGYVVVTDENGEPVTDENGNVVTEPVSPTSAEASADPSESESAAQQTTQGAAQTTAAPQGTTKEPITKLPAPSAVSGLKVAKVTENSIEFTWDKADCTEYEVSFSKTAKSNEWEYDKTDKNKYTLKECGGETLDAGTTYYFCVRARNTNGAGTSASAWTAVITGTTKALDKEREITFRIQLPANGQTENVKLWVGNELVYEGENKCYGDRIAFTTDKKYKGEVTCWAELEYAGLTKKLNVSGYYADFDMSTTGMNVIVDDDDV